MRRALFASAHITSGVAVGLALGMQGLDLALFVAASVLTDWDYALQLLTGRNHRTFVTHSPLLYIVAFLPLGFVDSRAWLLLAGAMLHFTLDLWDYGIRLDPFRNRIFGARLIPGIERLGFRDYVRTYFGDRRFAALEAALALAAVAFVLVKLA